MKRKSRILLLALALALLLLLAACSRAAPRPPFLPPVEPVPPPEMRWDVRTDFSILTPFVPQFTMHTRLHDGPLPELIPSNGYGMLLPYASPIVLPDGSLRGSKFGLVTIDGVIVTDLVYDHVQRAESTNQFGYNMLSRPAPLPAYQLSINIPGADMQWGAQSMQAVCALDGSWVTPFDYVNVIFTDDVIILLRSHDSYDVDVYDYSGRLLYNMLDLEWVSRLADQSWPGEMVYSVREGYGNVALPDGTCAFIDIRTGRAHYTEFAMAHPFSGGFAAVAINTGNFGPVQQLWGFINKDFELVIPLIYEWPSMFRDGRAIVQLPGGAQQVINTRGQTLFYVPPGFYMDHNYSGPSFVMYDQGGSSREELIQFFTTDLAPIRLPDGLVDVHTLEHINDEWFLCRSFDGFNGSVLFTNDKDYFLPNVHHVSFFDGEFIVFADKFENEIRSGVRTLDGREVVQPERNLSISAVAEEGRAKAFVVNTHSTILFSMGGASQYRRSAYRLVGTDGETIISGSGMLTFDEAAGLYSVLGADHFKWLDKDANTIISIPMMSFAFD